MMGGPKSLADHAAPSPNPQSQIPSPKSARPFLKWAGGKQQLLAQYEQYFPTEFSRYIEPFLGGGAVFFHLWSTGRLPGDVLLFDNNEELISTYRVVRDEVEKLIEALAAHKEKHSREHYYKTRDLDRSDDWFAARCSQLPGWEVRRAARTIYLNKTCYNGLYRVNSKGQFNVPMGSYKNPKILDEEVLRAASAAPKGVVLETKDFRTLPDLCKAGDFIYMDPPYHPLTRTASFRSYTAASFGEQDQRDLAEVFKQLAAKGCLCMLSNSSTPLIQDLYEAFRLETVEANRAISCAPIGRVGVPEAVVTSL